MLRMSTVSLVFVAGFLAAILISSAAVASKELANSWARSSAQIELERAEREAGMDLLAAQRQHDRKLRADLSAGAENKNPAQATARGSDAADREPASTSN